LHARMGQNGKTDYGQIAMPSVVRVYNKDTNVFGLMHWRI